MLSSTSDRHFCINRRDLYNALVLLSRLIKSNSLSRSSVLSNILIASNGSQLVITSTDLENWLSFNIDFNGTFGPILLDAKQLKDLVKCSRNNVSNVNFFLMGEDDLIIDVDGVIVNNILVGDYKDYPECFDSNLKDTWECLGSIDSDELKSQLKWVLLASSSDSVTRPKISSVYFCDQIVATDGHRLHMSNTPNGVDFETNNVLISKFSSEILYRILNPKHEVFFYRIIDDSKKYLMIRCGSWCLKLKQLDYLFLNYKSVLKDSSFKFSISVDMTLFKKYLKTILGTSNKEVKHVELDIGRDLKISLEGASCNLQICSSNLVDGLRYSLTLNGNYILDAINAGKNIDDELSIDFDDELDPVRFKLNKELTAIVMPCRP